MELFNEKPHPGGPKLQPAPGVPPLLVVGQSLHLFGFTALIFKTREFS